MHSPNLTGWILIIFVALFVFGPKKLPEIGRTLGKAFREFRSSAEGLLTEDKEKKEEASQTKKDA